MIEEKEKQDELLEALSGIQTELNGIKKKGPKQVLQIIISVVLALIIGLGAGVVCGQHWDDIMLKLLPNSYSNQTITILEEKLDKQAKLNTGLYNQTSTYDSGKMYNNKIAEKLKLNSKSMKFTYSGQVEAGIQDLSKVKISINSKTNVITIKNLKIEITNVYIDPSSIKDTKQTKNIFNQLTINDFISSQKYLEEQLIADAKKANIITVAQESAEETLKNLFGDAITGYDIVFIWE